MIVANIQECCDTNKDFNILGCCSDLANIQNPFSFSKRKDIKTIIYTGLYGKFSNFSICARIYAKKEFGAVVPSNLVSHHCSMYT